MKLNFKNMNLLKNCLIKFNNKFTNQIEDWQVDNDIELKFTLLDMQKFAKKYYKKAQKKQKLNIDLEKLKDIVENKFSVNLTEKNRKRHIVYSKRVYLKLARSFNKHSLSVIGKTINLSHSSVCHHLKEFEMIEDLHKIGYNEIVKEYGFNAELTHIKKQVKFLKKIENKTNLPAYIVDHLKEYTEEQLLEVYATRLKPYKKMQDSKITDLDLIEKQLKQRQSV